MARFQARTFRGERRKPLAMPLHGRVVDGDVLPVRIAKIAPVANQRSRENRAPRETDCGIIGSAELFGP